MNKFIDFILQNFKKELLVLGLLGIVSSCTSLIMNYSLKYAVDYAFGREGTRLWIALTWFLIMAISTFVTDRLGEGYLAEKYRILFVKEIREKLVEAYEKKSYGFAQKKELGDLLNTRSYLLNCLRLLVCRGGYLRNQLRALLGKPGDLLEGLGGLLCNAGAVLYRVDRGGNQLACAVRGFSRLGSKVAYLVRDYREALSGFSCAGSFYRGVQREYVRLECDVLDGLYDLGYRFGLLFDLIHCFKHALHLAALAYHLLGAVVGDIACLVGVLGGLVDVAGDLRNCGGQLVDCGSLAGRAFREEL